MIGYTILSLYWIMVRGAVVNLEDYEQLKDEHADCRLLQLPDWRVGRGQGNFDLRNLTRSWKRISRQDQYQRQHQNSNQYQKYYGQDQYQKYYGQDQYQNYYGQDQSQRQYGQYQNYYGQDIGQYGGGEGWSNYSSTGNATQQIPVIHINTNTTQNDTYGQQTMQDTSDIQQQNGSNNAQEDSALLQEIVRLTNSSQVTSNNGTQQSEQIKQSQQIEESQREYNEILKQKLNECRRERINQQTYGQTLIELLEASTLSNSFQSEKQEIYQFGNYTQSLLKFWRRVRQSRSQPWQQLTQRQEWTALQKIMKEGQKSADQSEVYRNAVKKWVGETGSGVRKDKSWLMASCQEINEYLRRRGKVMLPGLGLFGFMVSEALDYGMAGPTGSAFSLRQSPPAPSTAPIGSADRDLTVLTAERIIPRDLSNQVKTAIYGKVLRKGGRTYKYDSATGTFKVTCDRRAKSASEQANELEMKTNSEAVMTSPMGYYDWQTGGRWIRRRGWWDAMNQVYRSPLGWYDPHTRLYHTKRTTIGGRRRACGRPIDPHAPPAIVVRPVGQPLKV